MSETCPQCPNACPKEALRCPRGRAHFGMEEGGGPSHPGQEPRTLEDRVVVAMRRCGHYLHHSAGNGAQTDNAGLLAALSEEEKETLCTLLGKCLESWQ